MNEKQRPMLTLTEVDAYLLQKEAAKVNEQIQDGQEINLDLHLQAYQQQLQEMYPEAKIGLYDEAQSAEIEELKSHSWLYLDKLRFFNRTDAIANLDHYLSLVMWTREEAVALCFGKNPNVVNFDSLNAYVHDNDNDPQAKYSAFITDYFNVRDMLLSDPSVPEKEVPLFFLNWFNSHRVIIHDDLQQKVVQRKMIASSAYDWIEEGLMAALNDELLSYDEVAADGVPQKTHAMEKVTHIDRRVKNNYLRVIATLLEFIEGTTEGVQAHPQFKNITAFIELLSEKYYDNRVRGLSRRNLMTLFRSAREQLKY